MKILKAIENCRKTKKNYAAQNGLISAVLYYDKKDGSILIDYSNEEEGFGMGQFISAKYTEVQILEILRFFENELNDFDFEETTDNI